jgi:ABC-type antimicrobial peptide transport system permease subunit
VSASGAADLSKLRINRDDPPPAVKRALGRVLWIVAAAALVFVVMILVARRSGAPLLLAIGIAFGVVMGVIGGFFPAWRAARLQVVQALR